MPKTIHKRRQTNVLTEMAGQKEYWEMVCRVLKDRPPVNIFISPFLHIWQQTEAPARPHRTSAHWTWFEGVRGGKAGKKHLLEYASEHGVPVKKSWSKVKLASVLFDCPESWCAVGCRYPYYADTQHCFLTTKNGASFYPADNPKGLTRFERD